MCDNCLTALSYRFISWNKNKEGDAPQVISWNLLPLFGQNFLRLADSIFSHKRCTFSRKTPANDKHLPTPPISNYDKTIIYVHPKNKSLTHKILIIIH